MSTGLSPAGDGNIAMAYKPQYLEKIRATRGPRPVGELFAMKLRGIGYVFGRVIRDACAWAPSHSSRRKAKLEPSTYLVYIYKGVSDSLDDEPVLRPDDLLLPPQIIFGHGWTLGYFAPVRHASLTAADVLPVHCFWSAHGFYVDEFGRTLAKRVEPCGHFGLGTYGNIERDIAAAFGLSYDDPEAAPSSEGRPGRGTRVAATGTEPLDEKKFWAIIKSLKASSRGDRDAFLELLEERVSEWEGHNLCALQARIDDLMTRAYTWDLWGAAFIMNGGCSDDGFEHWRAWLISQGREVYEAALTDAETLASRKLAFGEPEDYFFEDLLMLPARVLESTTGEQVDLPPRRESGRPRGRRWTEAQLPKRFPKLWRKFAPAWYDEPSGES